MKDLERKFPKPGDLVLDSFVRTLCTAKACQLLENHRRFAGCEKDGGCVPQSMAGLWIYGGLLNDKSDLEGGEELMEAA